MAKKFVRGITGIKNIKKQDLDTNNVNDLLSDGEHNYIHRKKKDKTEEYHNLTNNIKTIDSDNTSLLSVTNYNNTKNSATIHPHHDAQKEQVLESTNGTITINHAENGTSEKTSVDVTPDKIRSICKPTVEFYQAVGGTGGYMKTMKTWYGDGTLEFKFWVNIQKGVSNIEFKMNQTDLDYMYYIIQLYGQEGRINIQGSSIQIFPNATRIYFASNGSQFNPHFVVFYDIIPIDVPSSRTEQVENVEKEETE